MPKTLNTWTLAGLMVGPILGSGIVFLPPLAFSLLGPQAVWAWVAVLAVGAAFAAVFVRLALQTKSDIGLAGLVAREWGPVWGELASNYLTGAVVFGLVPVVLTAAKLWPTALSGGLPPLAVAFILLALTTGLLIAGLTTVSRLSLVLSSATAVCLFAGAGAALWGGFTWPPFSPQPSFGPALLLLFWAIVGWEVIGTYSNQVRDPDRTIPRAGLISFAAVTAVYLFVALALQNFRGSAPSMADVLSPLWGPLSPFVAGILGGGLCVAAVLMFCGAVTRMTAQRARDGQVPRWLAEKKEHSTPRRAIFVLATTAVALLTLVGCGWVTLESLVSIANLFFLGNALLGLAAAWKMLRGRAWRLSILVLALVLVALLTQGHIVGGVLVAVITALTLAAPRFRATR